MSYPAYVTIFFLVATVILAFIGIAGFQRRRAEQLARQQVLQCEPDFTSTPAPASVAVAPSGRVNPFWWFMLALALIGLVAFIYWASGGSKGLYPEPTLPKTYKIPPIRLAPSAFDKEKSKDVTAPAGSNTVIVNQGGKLIYRVYLGEKPGNETVFSFDFWLDETKVGKVGFQVNDTPHPDTFLSGGKKTTSGLTRFAIKGQELQKGWNELALLPKDIQLIINGDKPIAVYQR